jgi:signal transduction histidine kinase
MFIPYSIEPEMLYMALAASAVLYAILRRTQPLAYAFNRAFSPRPEVPCTSLHEKEYKLLANLSHNLQTPLAVLKLRIERLERTILRDGQATCLLESVDSLSQAVNELLALSNLERGPEPDLREPFSLSGLLASVAEDCGTVAEANGIRFKADIEPDVQFSGNQRHMRDAMVNLVSNAIKYMGNGPSKNIHMSLTREPCLVRIEVRDTGMGIAEDELPYIFDRFYRCRQRVYGTIPGTGIGLAIVKHVVEEHLGEIRVQSEIGKGSTFTITLPQGV